MNCFATNVHVMHSGVWSPWGGRLWWRGLAVGAGEGEVAARVWERGAKSLRAEG
jgi:hypothetical protein